MVNTKNIDWKVGAFIVSYHVLLLVLVPLYFFMQIPSTGIVITAVLTGIVSMLVMTVGYHRFYAHRAYEINKFGEIIILCLGSLAMQGSALRWAHDHRIHHKYIDTEKDPYSIKKGFWYAHIGWLFRKSEEINPATIPDLMANKVLLFQHKYHMTLMILTNLIVVLGSAIVFRDISGAIIFVFLTRMFVTHHLTWFINSWAHTVGSKPYSKEHSAVNNAILAWFTFGEGYHNYHHTFPSDYRNGVRWYQYDPTKIAIWCLARIGIARNLKKVELALIKRKMILEDQRMVLEKIKMLGHKKMKNMEEKIRKLAEDLNAKLLEKYVLMIKYQMKKKEERKEMKMKIKALKKNIQEEYRVWIKMCSEVLAAKTM